MRLWITLLPNLQESEAFLILFKHLSAFKLAFLYFCRGARLPMPHLSGCPACCIGGDFSTSCLVCKLLEFI